MTTDPIRVGIIGVHPEKGWATATHIPALRQLGQFHLSAISHHRLDIAKAAAAHFENGWPCPPTDKLSLFSLSVSELTPFV